MPETPPKPVIYDEAAFHQGAPVFSGMGVDPEDGGTHIGFYLGWVIISRLESFALRQLAPGPVEEVRSRQMTGRAFLFAHCEGKLTSRALNKEAQAFTEFYYVDRYLRDYQDVLASKAQHTYAVTDSWANYERLAVVIDAQLREFRGMKPAAASFSR